MSNRNELITMNKVPFLVPSHKFVSCIIFTFIIGISASLLEAEILAGFLFLAVAVLFTDYTNFK